MGEKATQTVTMFMGLGIFIWYVSLGVTANPVVRLAILIGVGVVVPLLINEPRTKPQPVNRLGVKPRGFPWVSRTLPSDHRPDSLERSGGSRSGRPRPPMPAVVVRKSKIFVITRDSVSRSTPSEQLEGC